jgi:hypothetical protein
MGLHQNRRTGCAAVEKGRSGNPLAIKTSDFERRLQLVEADHFDPGSQPA